MAVLESTFENFFLCLALCLTLASNNIHLGQPSLMFAGKVKALPKMEHTKGAPFGQPYSQTLD